MASQGDSNDPKRTDSYIDHAPSGSNTLPIIGGLVALGVLALLIFSLAGDRPTGDPVTPRSPGATAPTGAPPTATTPAPTPAKPQ
jgi:hypothetical protein